MKIVSKRGRDLVAARQQELIDDAVVIYKVPQRGKPRVFYIDPAPLEPMDITNWAPIQLVPPPDYSCALDRINVSRLVRVLRDALNKADFEVQQRGSDFEVLS